MPTTIHVSPRGTITLPVAIRQRLKLDRENSLLIIEERPDGVFLHPAVTVPIRDLSVEQMQKWIDQDEADAASVKIQKPC
jgi:bifunctional DNA-binding transcriptional regulator/antitoxin component of YhaV-PrlF toxin-antitoxin module